MNNPVIHEKLIRQPKPDKLDMPTSPKTPFSLNIQYSNPCYNKLTYDNEIRQIREKTNKSLIDLQYAIDNPQVMNRLVIYPYWRRLEIEDYYVIRNNLNSLQLTLIHQKIKLMIKEYQSEADNLYNEYFLANPTEIKRKIKTIRRQLWQKQSKEQIKIIPATSTNTLPVGLSKPIAKIESKDNLPSNIFTVPKLTNSRESRQISESSNSVYYILYKDRNNILDNKTYLTRKWNELIKTLDIESINTIP